MPEKPKIAIIGLGRWGSILSAELEKQARVKWKCDSGSDLETVFSDAEVNSVFIATPTSTHFDLARKALSAGKHVFLEKPGTTSAKDLEVLVSLAEEKGLRLAIGYEFPHHTAVRKLKELLRGKKVVDMRFSWLKWGTFRDDAIPHLLSHDISVALYLGVSDLSVVSAKKTAVITESDIVETEFTGSGARIYSYIDRVYPGKDKSLSIFTADNGFVWHNEELYVIDKDSQTHEVVEIGDSSPVSNEIADFLASVEEGQQPIVDGRFALEVYKIVEQADSLASH